MKKILFLLMFFVNPLESREVGQTEITTEEGIEVYQKEKYYLLKKNVIIESDRFSLSAQKVKAFFEKDLYDITDIYSEVDVYLKSPRGLEASGEKIDFNAKKEDIYIEGQKSYLKTSDFEMMSDFSIKVNNSTGNFKVIGPNSKIVSVDYTILGEDIKGNFINVDGETIVQKLYVVDKNQVNIVTETLDMYSKRAEFDREKDIIELFKNVIIYREEEMITGDYAKINTVDESYIIKSDSSKKVKVLLNSKDE